MHGNKAEVYRMMRGGKTLQGVYPTSEKPGARPGLLVHKS